MEGKVASVFSAVVGGIPTFYIFDNVILPVAVAFICGLAGYYANKLARKIDSKRKSNHKSE
ncbi:MAG: hypothetical protein RBS07_15810 [Lentimicrobium sp.]|jgi:hypothetical protein|nr:hypothetical protein [Lentimicrobium sp.]